MFHITNEEAVGRGTFAAERLEDGVLRFVDVLIFIHKNETKLFAPMLGDGRGLFRRAVPQETKGMLFQVVKIHQSLLAFGIGERDAKFARQLQ